MKKRIGCSSSAWWTGRQKAEPLLSERVSRRDTKRLIVKPFLSAWVVFVILAVACSSSESVSNPDARVGSVPSTSTTRATPKLPAVIGFTRGSDSITVRLAVDRNTLQAAVGGIGVRVTDDHGNKYLGKHSLGRNLPDMWQWINYLPSGFIFIEPIMVKIPRAAPITRMAIEGLDNYVVPGPPVFTKTVALQQGQPTIVDIGNPIYLNSASALPLGEWTKLDGFLATKQVSQLTEESERSVVLEFQNSDYNALTVALPWAYLQDRDGVISGVEGYSTQYGPATYCTSHGQSNPRCSITIDGQSTEQIQVRLGGTPSGDSLAFVILRIRAEKRGEKTRFYTLIIPSGSQ